MNDAMSDAGPSEKRAEPGGQSATAPLKSAELKPKGACWYCNQPLDNVRRFCSKTCADDYRIEEEAFNNPPHKKRAPARAISEISEPPRRRRLWLDPGFQQ